MDGKEVGEHRDSVASHQKSSTKRFKTELLLGFLSGKAYICSESLSGKIRFGEMELNMIWEKEYEASLYQERLYFENKEFNMIGERNSI